MNHMNYHIAYQARNLSSQADISVIVPCFNSENYISKCLSSILNQDQVQIELLIVNDGSTDSTLEKILNMVNQYPQISTKVFSSTDACGSPAVPRNFALREASGAYIQFVDSDDWHDQYYLLNMYKQCVISNCDICFASGFVNWQRALKRFESTVLILWLIMLAKHMVITKALWYGISYGEESF